ncbi:WAT1-related protein At1g25270 [Linum perenne]
MIMVVIQVSYTVSIVLYKLAANHGMNLRVLIAYRLMFATVFITPLAVILERASLAQTLYAESLGLTSATFAAAMTNLGPAVTLLLAMLFRLESLKLKTGVGQAKLVGTMIGVTGATILTFYKGVALKSSSKNIHSSQENHHQIAGTNNFLGLLTALGSCISRAIWLIMQTKMGEKYPSCHYSSTALMLLMASIQSLCFCVFVERDWSQWKLEWNIGLLAAGFAVQMQENLIHVSTVHLK